MQRLTLDQAKPSFVLAMDDMVDLIDNLEKALEESDFSEFAM